MVESPGRHCLFVTTSFFVIPEIASAIIRDPEANPDLFYSWVPDTVRLATLARSSGTTGSDSVQLRGHDDNVLNCHL